MPIKFKTYDVLYLRDGVQVEAEVIVYKSDELRAELEGRRSHLRGPVGGQDGVTDLGDHLNIEALEIWAALVRTEQYEAKSQQFRLQDCLAWSKHKDPSDENKALLTPVDPTRPDTSTELDSPAPPSTETPPTGYPLT